MKRRTWLGVLIGVAVAVAIVAGVFIDLKRKAAAILEKHERATLAKIEEFRSRSWPRVVMIGEALKGNRWDDLTKALDAFDGIPKVDLDELPGFQDSDPDAKGDPERIDAVLAKHQSCVDQLRAACRRNDLRPPYAYEDAYSMDLPYVTKAIQACRYLGVVAGRLHELGRDREAADAALLALSVAQDMDCGGPAVNHLVGIVCEQHGTRALRKVIEAHALSAGDLLEIGAMLDRLWGSRPRVLESLEIEDTIARLGLVRLVDDRNGAAAIGWGGAPKSWRHFFSVTLMFAEALNEYEVFFAEAMRIDALRGPERREAADALHRRTSGSRNPIVAQMLPTVAKVLRRDMMAEMNWNLMRTSVALAAYEKERGAFPSKLEELVPRYLSRVANCPTSGKPVQMAPGKAWAFGGDGDDDGGRPMVDEDREDEDGDVVWTVKRK